MNYSTKIISDLHEEFEGITFDFQEIKYEGKLPCFFISVESELKLAEVWMRVSDIIAINYQATLNDEFSIWNIYLFFFIEETISNELKYLIENDTFSSRKIIIERKYDLNKIIEEHILNTDISIDSTPICESNFTPNPIIYKQLENLETKLKVTQSIKEAHSQIINTIKNKSHEI